MDVFVGAMRRISLLNASSVYRVYRCSCSATVTTAIRLSSPQPNTGATVTLDLAGDERRRSVRRPTSTFVGNGSGDGDAPWTRRLKPYPRQERTTGKDFSSQPTAHEEGSVRGVRLSLLLCRLLGLSRRQSERMILTERVTLFGKKITSPAFELRPSEDPRQDSTTAMKVDGKLVKDVQTTLKRMLAEQRHEQLSSVSDNGTVRKHNKTDDYSTTRIWLVNKFKGELITEDDPFGRPSMLQRLVRGGVGKSGKKNGIGPPLHLKPVGRLDMMTEGLMILTNDGRYARELELPTNRLWRTYRARVHGRLSEGKLRAMRRGLTVHQNDGAMGNGDSGDVARPGKLMRYKGMKVALERKSLATRRRGGAGANTWLRITCAEGKNRQLRRILAALGLDVTRLIRVSYGDYDLHTIPPGMALEVPCKGLERMTRKGPLFPVNCRKDGRRVARAENSAGVRWATSA